LIIILKIEINANCNTIRRFAFNVSNGFSQ
jgi:hypothetical protein